MNHHPTEHRPPPEGFRNFFNMKRSLTILGAISACLLTSCAGYRLGGGKPAALAEVRVISVPMFTNGTAHPRAEVFATSAVARAMTQDGTYQLGQVDRADAILEGHVKSIRYINLRGTRFDTLYPEELQNRVTLSWTLRDARNPIKVLASGSAEGTGRFSVTPNLQTARNNALPEALSQAGESMVSQIASGY